MFTGCIQLASRNVWQHCDVTSRKYCKVPHANFETHSAGNWRQSESSWETRDLEQLLLDHISQLIKSLPAVGKYTTQHVWYDLTCWGMIHESVIWTWQGGAGNLKYCCGEVLLTWYQSRNPTRDTDVFLLAILGLNSLWPEELISIRQHFPALGTQVNLVRLLIWVFCTGGYEGPSICCIWNLKINWQGTLMHNFYVLRVSNVCQRAGSVERDTLVST